MANYATNSAPISLAPIPGLQLEVAVQSNDSSVGTVLYIGHS